MKRKNQRNHRKHLSKVNSLSFLKKKMYLTKINSLLGLIFFIFPCLSEKTGHVQFKSIPTDIGISTDDAYDFNTDFK